MPEVLAYATDDKSSKFHRTTITRREPGPTEVYFENKYAGICHSDIHTAREEWGKVNYPLVPGHELAGIVTQNTDGLHLVAGSDPERVHEIHGNARRWRCENCGATGPLADMVERINAGDDDPRCPDCGGITRATVILFEEMLDPEVLDAGVRLAEAADLVLAIGTTLTVHPVAGLVPYAFGHSAKVVIINNQETPYDYLADAILREPIEEIVPQLIAAASRRSP